MYGSQKLKIVSAAALFFFVSSSALGKPSPQAISLGSGKLIPTIKITEKYNDNIFSQNDDLFDTTDTWISQLQPVVQFLSEVDASHIAFS